MAIVLIMGAIIPVVRRLGIVFVAVSVATAVLPARVQFVFAGSVAYHIVNIIFLYIDEVDILNEYVFW